MIRQMVRMGGAMDLVTGVGGCVMMGTAEGRQDRQACSLPSPGGASTQISASACSRWTDNGIA